MSDSFPVRAARREELRAFLIERRRQLELADREPPLRSTSQRGLSQADVAELAGVSLNWYELFESGRNDRRVSVAFIDRVATALRLDEADKRELYRLAARESEARARVRTSMEDGALATLRLIRRMARRVSSASDLREIAGIVAETMQEYTRADSATIVSLNGARGVTGFAVGPRARYANDAIYQLQWNALQNLPLDRVGTITGGATREELMQRPIDLAVETIGDCDQVRLDDLRFTPELYQATCYRVRGVTELSLPLAEDQRLAGLVGICWMHPRTFVQAEVETATTVASIVQLITAGDH